MSDDKKVWLSFPDNFDTVNIYSIEMNIPGLYDILALQECKMKWLKDRENEELRKKMRELSDYGVQIARMIRGYKKFPVLPDGLWLVPNDVEYPQDSEYLFRIRGGGVVLREACANIFQQFRLGETTLTPVKIHQPLSHELLNDETYYFLNLCEKRWFVRKEQQHKELKYLEYDAEDWEYTDKSIGVNVDGVELERAAGDCDIDLWHDPRLRRSYFMSDRLYQALLNAGFADAWAVGACRLI